MADDLSELGTSGLRRASGFITDDPLPSLQGPRGVRTFRDMSENDPVVGAMLFAIEKVITRLEWRLDPADDSPEAQATAEFVDGCLHDMSESWDVTLQSILSMLIYGWSFHEIVYKRRGGPEQTDPSRRSKFNDGRIGWRKWAIRGQETLWQWAMDPAGGVQGMIQMDPYNLHAKAASDPRAVAEQQQAQNPFAGGGSQTIDGHSINTTTGTVLIPINKGLLFRVSAQKGNPQGRSLLRNAYRPWFYKKRIEEIEAVGIERDLAGLPVAYVPPEYLSSAATAEQQQVLSVVQQIVTSIKRNEQEGIVFPTVYDDGGHKLFDLTLLSAGGQRQFDTDKVISRYDQRIAMSVLADFILLGHERVGSFALGTSKMDLWTMSVDAIAKSITEVVNTHAIPRLLQLNGMSQGQPPSLAYGEVAHVDLGEVADFVQKLAAAGALMPDQPLEEYLRSIGGLPPAEADRGVMPEATTIPTAERS